MAIPRHPDPIVLFQKWLEEAKKADLVEPTAFTLGTVDAHGRPSARVLLLKGVDERGFVFYTNLKSRKARELRDNPLTTLCFYWMPLYKQVRVEGRAELVSPEEADAYFASRPRESQLGAWASKQSEPLEGRFELERRVAKYAIQFNIRKVPRPEFWSGYRVTPDRIEFWQALPFRLHDRLLYTRDPESGGWSMQALFP